MRQLNSKVFILLFLCCFTFVPAFVNAQTGDLTAKGQYIFVLAGGCACNTVPKGTPHIGGRAFPIPFVPAYITKIKQDKQTALGGWTGPQMEIIMVKGVHSSWSRLLPDV